MERISMKKIKEILQLKFITDMSIRAIGRAVNVPPSTVSDYCKKIVKHPVLHLHTKYIFYFHI